MSRIGKKTIAIPEKAEFKISGDNLVEVKGPKGNLSFQVNSKLKVEQKDKEINVSVLDEHRKVRALWGMTRTLIDNMLVGVTTGFTKTLEFNGVGYKASVSGNNLVLNLGYSHSIDYPLPEGITAKVAGKTIEISGCNKELVGFVAAKVRGMRPPEPYKGKGVKYADERIIRKAGKTGAKK